MKQLWEFETELKPIQICGGKRIPKRKAVVRSDTGAVLGIVGENYEGVPHSRVIDTFNGLEFLKRRNVDVCRDGAILFAQYDFTNGLDIKEAQIQVGDIVNFGLRAFNSFNSQFGVGFELNALQLRCKNGLVIPRTIARLSFRHFQNVDVTKFAELITSRTGEIHNAVETWKNWLKIRPDDEKIQKFLNEIKMGKRFQKEMLPEIQDGVEKEGVWGLFSAMTRHITHDLKIRGDESNRMLAVRNKEREFLYKFYSYSWN